MSQKTKEAGAGRYQSNKYCVCAACIYNEGLCETLVELEKHLNIVATLTINDHRITTVEFFYPHSPACANATCPTVLLAYFSAYFNRELERLLLQGKFLSHIVFTDESAHGDDLKALVTWCRFGQIKLEGTPHFSTGCRIERLWYLAAKLEMPEFANFCMRLVMAKYSWNFYGNPTTPTLDLEHAPYELLGPLYVVRQRKSLWDLRDPKRSSLTLPSGSLLFQFMDSLTYRRSALRPEVVAHVKDAHMYTQKCRRAFINTTIQKWLFDPSLFFLLKIDWEYLPTNPKYWPLFQLPIPERDAESWYNNLCFQYSYQEATDERTVTGEFGDATCFSASKLRQNSQLDPNRHLWIELWKIQEDASDTSSAKESGQDHYFEQYMSAGSNKLRVSPSENDWF
ncbi:hypothetical protein F5B20DRAFT_234001 [Whalleya microplaca]|nr:hypothetical protein F5B20DRAFT_234001 [Whalleya microplaca]